MSSKEMSSKDKTRQEIDEAIARIDAKLAAGSDDATQLQDERRHLEEAQTKQEETGKSAGP